MEIRRLNPSDTSMYRTLRLDSLQLNPTSFSASYEEESKWPDSSFEQRLTNPDAFTFGAFEESVLIGMVTLVKENKPKLKHRASIAAMYVAPAKRGKGAAKKLLAEAIKTADKLQSIEQIYLSVEATNHPAVKLYESFGFKVYGKDVNAMKIKEIYYDEALMVLYLQNAK